MTYGEIYNMFTNRNKYLVPHIVDYRPAGKNRLEIFLKNNITMYVTYNQETDKFEI